MDSKNNIYDLTIDQLEKVVLSLNEKKYRANQIYDWLHKTGVISYDEMKNLPLRFRDELQNKYPIYTITISAIQQSKDGTKKFLLNLYDGLKVESVLIPDHLDNRLTACISTQVGCPVGCQFCATGKQGFFRNLSFQEITSQIQIMQNESKARISNVVIMGQGEPFLNYDSTIKAMQILNHDEAYKIAARKITVSTSGVIDKIRKFSNVPEQFGLAISLHSADQAVRNVIMPKMSNQPLESLSEALREYVDKTNRRVTLEYMLLKDITDTDDALKKLISFASTFLSHVNLLSFNQIEGVIFRSSSLTKLKYFEDKLKKAGIPASIRSSKGSDIQGACGQLANNS